MSVQITRNVNISGCGMPMMPMMPTGGCCTPAMPIFGGCCTPVPVMGCGMMNNDMAAGYCVGTALGTPGVLNAIGSGIQWGYNNIVKPVINFAGQALKWGYNNIVLPVWNNVVKPAWNFAYNNILKPVGNFLWNDVLKPIGNGLKWIWDHTLGWVLKKIGNSSSSSSKAEKETAEATTES